MLKLRKINPIVREPGDERANDSSLWVGNYDQLLVTMLNDVPINASSLSDLSTLPELDGLEAAQGLLNNIASSLALCMLEATDDAGSKQTIFDPVRTMHVFKTIEMISNEFSQYTRDVQLRRTECEHTSGSERPNYHVCKTCHSMVDDD